MPLLLVGVVTQPCTREVMSMVTYCGPVTENVVTAPPMVGIVA